eukprot:1157898-Pelagomonas_calceolata.AAC.4
MRHGRGEWRRLNRRHMNTVRTRGSTGTQKRREWSQRRDLTHPTIQTFSRKLDDFMLLAQVLSHELTTMGRHLSLCVDSLHVSHQLQGLLLTLPEPERFRSMNMHQAEMVHFTHLSSSKYVPVMYDPTLCSRSSGEPWGAKKYTLRWHHPLTCSSHV